MNIAGFIALHYGVPYLNYAIRSIIDAVDTLYIVYTDKPSHGHSTSLVNPDSREDLIDIAYSAAGDKLRWFEGHFTHEGTHRDLIFQIAPKADVVLVCDSDEVWCEADLQRLINAATSGINRNYLAYEYAFWRAFNRAIPGRLCAPVRAINTRNPKGDQLTDAHFLHFGYAQPTRYIEYKMSLHGHKADWRPNWFKEKWLANAQTDIHPTNYDFWNTVMIDPREVMPDYMSAHPYAKMAVIE